MQETIVRASMNTYLCITRMWGVVIDEAREGGRTKLQTARNKILTTVDWMYYRGTADWRARKG